MLDEFQKQAVEHDKGPALVIAGPGSGKTKCIVERIQRLIDRGTPPTKILVITFTREAAAEMESRFLREQGSGGRGGVHFSTFHSLFYHILIDRYGQKAIDPKTEKEKKNFYDSLGSRTMRLFSDEKNTLEKWRNTFSYILVDEFQDINEEQFDIIKQLLTDEKNLFAVGDDDQSIYSFRGSSPKIMLSFFDIFPEGKRIVLLNNYRSARRIVEAGANIIANNKKRYKKDISAYSSLFGVEKTMLLSDEISECEFVTGEIKKCLSQKEGTIGILYRNRYQSLLLRERLMMEHIPFFSKEKLPSIRAYFICRDMMSALSVTYGKGCAEDKERFFAAFGGKSDLLETASLLSPYAAVNYMCKAGGYERYLLKKAARNKIYEAELFERLDQVKRLFLSLKTKRDFFDLKELPIEEGEECKESRVGLYTFHGSKGLEFDEVIIIDANESITPSPQASDEQLEEERRMFYVAVTRAKRALYIISLQRRNKKKLYPSRFVSELGTK